MTKKLFSIFFSIIFLASSNGFCDTQNTSSIEESAANGDKDDCFHLANHNYFHSKCYRKAIYWAFKGAELGSSDCMLLLRKAYGEGFGVIQDTEECLMWLFLAASIGNEKAQKEVRDLECTNIALYQTLSESSLKYLEKEREKQWDEAKRRAKAWMKSHNELFFSPN